ncbi:MAG: sigma-70 family RNA polymerase sigma factor [Bacilli bacterium]|nr:sigma-70 family RNA polymerase sigma factor [Bacilli bacterium]
MKNYKVEITNLNTSNIKVLSKKEMDELFKRYQDGDKKAKDLLIEGNLKLVLSILKKYNNGKHNVDDLFQVGVVGLIKAIDNFDLSYNLMFSTYAVTLIMGEMRRYIRDNTPFRVSRSIKELSYDILAFKEEYQKKHGIDPSFKEIADNFNVTEYEISNALESLTPTISIYEPVYEDGGEPIYLLDQLSNSKYGNVERDNIISLNGALDKLKKREREVLLKRYIIGKTQIELADEYNISQAQVSRIEKSALNNIKKLLD